jgi:hypothetical protein
MRGRAWLWLSVVLLAIYTAYVLVAKFGSLVGVKLPFKLGDIGEFWLFAACIGFFCLQIIRDERALRAASVPQTGGAEQDPGALKPEGLKT